LRSGLMRTSGTVIRWPWITGSCTSPRDRISAIAWRITSPARNARWLGPAPERPFHRAYLPFVWRGWTDFGCGALGDMGSYSFDTIFRVLKLEAPVSVEASSTDRYDETYPLASIVRYNFPARGDMPPVKFSWYDGGLKPWRPDELEENRPLKGDGEEEDEGLLFIGDRGRILCRFNGGNPKIIPETKMDNYKQPLKTLPRSPGNERE